MVSVYSLNQSVLEEGIGGYFDIDQIPTTKFHLFQMILSLCKCIFLCLLILFSWYLNVPRLSQKFCGVIFVWYPGIPPSGQLGSTWMFPKCSQFYVLPSALFGKLGDFRSILNLLLVALGSWAGTRRFLVAYLVCSSLLLLALGWTRRFLVAFPI